MGQPADEDQVLPAGEILVYRGVLPCEPDAGADLLRVRDDVDAEHLGPTRVGSQDRRQDPHCGRLTGAIGTEQTEH